jgi:hypothetical protein
VPVPFRANRNPGRGLVALSFALVVAAGVFLRLLWLDRLPGINGDEAWYGVMAQQWATGHIALWRTPTGNYPGPIQPAFIALLQLVVEPGFMLLRIPSVVSSIAAMFLAWWIGKSQFGATTGRLALMLMASLPANIAYARFGWDPSHSGMLVLAGVLLSLNRQLVAVAAVYALAVWTHPTNVFAAPLILTVFAASERARATEPRSYRRIAALAICILLATAAVMSTASQAGQFANIESILARLITPSDWLTFVLLMGRLMAGEPWFVGIAGTGYGALLPVVDAATLTIAIAIAWHTIKVIRRQGFSVRAGLLIGWLFMVASYALIAGAPSLNAPTERYGFVLIAPTALVSALVLGAALARTTSATVASIAAILGGAGLLASTTLLYILPPGDAHDDNVRRVRQWPD